MSIVSESSNIWNHETKTIDRECTLGALAYRTVCGEILVDSPSGEQPNSAKVFYTAYFAQKSSRPILFLFNGGPGGSSSYLHFGGLGPKRIDHLDVLDSAPSTIIDNPETLLQHSDLVFVDPVGTGFSRCKEDCLKEFLTEQADAIYLGQFIVRFLSQNKLWGRDIQLCGESYGAYRVCLLSHLLMTQHQINPSRLLFIAPFISWVSIEAAAPNIIAEANTLVSFITIAWYHKRSSLNAALKDIQSVYEEARNFCFNEFLPLRIKHRPYELPQSLVEKISALTGISSEVYTKHGLNISTWSQFLFAGEKRYPGYVDGRFTLEHPLMFSPNFLDPAALSIERKMMPLVNFYFTQELGWDSKTAYTSYNPKVSSLWRFEEPDSAFASLRIAMKLNPVMQVYGAAGYYDLAVPASSVQYDLEQVSDTHQLAKRIAWDVFPAGHMMYIHHESRQLLLKALSQFCLLSIPGQGLIHI